MAQVFWTAEDYAVNDIPSDAWSPTGEVNAYEIREDTNGAKYLWVGDNNDTQALLRFIKGSLDFNEAQIYAKIKVIDAFTDISCALRADFVTTPSNPTAYRADFSNEENRISRLITGDFSKLAGGQLITTVDATGNYRFQIYGTALKAKFWVDPNPEPAAWTFEVSDSEITGAEFTDGGLKFFRGRGCQVYSFSAGTNGDPAPTAPVSAGNTGDTTGTSAANDSWSALCAAAASTTETATASDSLSVIASINTSIISAAQASDTSGESPAANVSLQSAATGSDSVDALASAAAALSAGAAAGESWTVQAQVVANLLDQAAASDQIARATDNAINAALSEGSAASDQFIAAINTLCSIQDSASARDALIAAVVTIAGISSGAVASDSFGVNFGQIKNIESGAISSDAWAMLASLTASLSEVCTAQDLMSAQADTAAAVTFGAVVTGTFAVVNQGIQYLVMGAITLRAALNQTVTIKP